MDSFKAELIINAFIALSNKSATKKFDFQLFGEFEDGKRDVLFSVSANNIIE